MKIGRRPTRPPMSTPARRMAAPARCLSAAVRTVAVALLAPALVVAVPAIGAAQDAPAGFDLASLEIPEGFLDLTDLVLTAREGGGVTATATTTLMNAETRVFVASTRAADGGKRRMTLGLKPNDWSLTESIPPLENPVLDQLTLSNVGLVLTGEELETGSADLSAQEYEFYRAIFQRDEFELRLEPGINLIAAIPLGELEEGNPLVPALDALGIERTGILLQGTLGQSLSLIGKGTPRADVVKDLYLRAELPPVQPPGSPEWFESGQLALEITGDPSVGMVGELTVVIDEDVLVFFVSGTAARTGMSLAGGLQSEDGWEQPFGIEWLIMREMILKVGITPAGSIQLGFGGDMVIGEKDMDVAVAVALNAATGVPTNFIFEGESEAGFGMPDLVELQARMAAARDAAGEATAADAGGEREGIPVDRLPQIAFREVGLQFAPKPEPDLGVERGMAIKGRLWLQTTPEGELEDFAGVDVAVGEDGLWARGDLGAFALGPLVWDDAELDLTATRDSQNFLISGEVDLFASRQMIDVRASRKEFSFETETRLFDLFTADLQANAAFDLRRPAFSVVGEAGNDFGDAVAPLLMERFAGVAENGEEVLAQAEEAQAALEEVLANQEATYEEVRAAVEAQRERARSRWREAQDAADAAYRTRSARYRSYLAAYRSWRGTAYWRSGLKAHRRVIMIRRRAAFARARTVHVARAAAAQARRRVLDAIPPVDQTAAGRTAAAALSELRTRLEASRDRLERLRYVFDRLLEAMETGVPPVTFRTARFSADLERMLQGEAARWEIEGTFTGEPFAIDRELNFADPERVAADLVTSLMER